MKHGRRFEGTVGEGIWEGFVYVWISGRCGIVSSYVGMR